MLGGTRSVRRRPWAQFDTGAARALLGGLVPDGSDRGDVPGADLLLGGDAGAESGGGLHCECHCVGYLRYQVQMVQVQRLLML